MQEKRCSVDSHPKTDKRSEDNQTRTFTDILLERDQVLKLSQKDSLKEKFDEIDNKDRRRSRNDPIGRDYKCGCGKMYLSYPALFGHIKQKHGGNKVQGTQKPMALNKRGRPRKDGGERQALFQKFSNYIQTLRIVEGSSIPDQHMRYLKFKKHISKFKQQETKSLSIKMSIDQVFSIYLFNIAQYCNSLFFNFLEQTFICFRSCLNQNHQKILKFQSKIFTYEIIINSQDDQQFTQINTCEFLPLSSDFFLLEYASKKVKKFDQKLLTCIVQDFCQWLVDCKLTRFKLQKNSNKKSVEDIIIFQESDDKE